MATVFTLPFTPALGVNGTVQSGALLYFYDAGTTTPKAVYSDPDLAVPHANPVVADSSGRFEDIYLDPLETYRVILKTSAGVTLGDVDDFSPVHDGSLRADLAASDGASLVGYGDTTVGGELAQLHNNILGTEGRKTFARDAAAGETMLDDQSEMAGYASHAGTTGGAGQTLYTVTNASDAVVEGSLRYCLEQAEAAGGGRILYDGTGRFRTLVESTIVIRCSNITIDAPARNVVLISPPNVHMMRLGQEISTGTDLRADNVIVRRLKFCRIPGTSGERDGLQVFPHLADKVWIDQCTFINHSDGALDIAASDVDTGMATQCRFTVSRCKFLFQEKGSIVGSTITSLDPAPAWAADALAQDEKILGTFYRNYFEGCAQRGPRVGPLAFVHSVNNVHQLVAHRMDDGTLSACYGIWATTGGKVLSECDYFRLASPTTGAIAIDVTTAAWDDTTNLGPGAANYSGSVAEDSLALNTANTSDIPTPPYTLTPEAVPASDRWAWVEEIRSEAGAEVFPVPDGRYRYVLKADGDTEGLYVDGFNVIRIEDGYLVRDPEARETAATGNVAKQFFIPRGATLDIATDDSITLESESFFAIDTEVTDVGPPEVHAASDTLSTINGGTNGMLIFFRCSSSGRPITVDNAGNINLPASVTLDHVGKVLGLIYDSGTAKWGQVTGW